MAKGSVGLQDPVQKKRAQEALTASEQMLQPLFEQLRRVEPSPDLRPGEAATLRNTAKTIAQVRLRREHPILGRVVELIVERLRDGKPQRLSDSETRALLDVMGSLSHAENDALKELRGLGIISDQAWQDIYEPARKKSNLEQQEQFNKVKWGSITFANQALPLAMVLTGMKLAGKNKWGAAAAVVTSFAVGMTVTPKVQEQINVAAAKEGRTLGMNVLAGAEVHDEARLMALRADTGNVLLGDQGTVLDRLRTEVALGDLLMRGRAQAGVASDAMSVRAAAIAGNYHEALSSLLSTSDKKKPSDSELRSRIVAARAKALRPVDVAELQALAMAARTQMDAKGQLLIALRLFGTLAGPALVDQLGASGGKPSDEAVQMARILARVAGGFDEKNTPIAPAVLSIIEVIAQGKTVANGEIKTLERHVQQAAAKVAQDGPSLQLNAERATAQAGKALAALWLQLGLDDPRGVKLDSKRNPDGSFAVTAAWGSAGQGKVTFNLTELGALDPATIRVDVGTETAANIGRRGTDHLLQLLGRGEKVATTKVERTGTPPHEKYVVSGTLSGGAMKTFTLDLTPAGAIDWEQARVS